MRNLLKAALSGLLLLICNSALAQEVVELAWKPKEKTAGIRPRADTKICTPTSSRADLPLYVARAKEKFLILSGSPVKQFDSAQILSIRILASKDIAAAKYGDKAKNGVVEVEISAKLLRQITKASKKQSLTKL